VSEQELAELRRVVDQVRRALPWSVSVEWAPDRPLPDDFAGRDLVHVRSHQAGDDVVLDFNEQTIADVHGREQAMAMAAAVTWMPTLLDEIERLREEYTALLSDAQDVAAAARKLHDLLVERRLHHDQELGPVCQTVMDLTSSDDSRRYDEQGIRFRPDPRDHDE
jgi:hypothetical protein